jgi:hypothetical protein
MTGGEVFDRECLEHRYPRSTHNHSRNETSLMKFKENGPFANPDVAQQELLELANANEPDHAGRLPVAAINKQFLAAGGTAEEYVAAVKSAAAHGWITMHPSGAYLSFTREGADLFA